LKLFTRKFVCLLALLPLLFANACNKKKATLPSSKTPAPTVAVVLPDEIPLAQAPEEPTPKPEEPQAAPPSPKSKPKKPARTTPTKTKKNTPSSSASAQQPSQSETQTVATLRPHTATPEAVPETALGAAVSSSKLQQQKDEATHIADSTENTLKGINRPLSEDEKSVKSQIESFLQQSRKATTDGDYERALNLAKKAQALVEALAK